MREQLTALRRAMAAAGVDYYVVPTDDFHSSEYVGDYFKCRAWLTGFTGSAGTCVAGREEAGLWTDGRYFIQAAAQLKDSGVDLYKMGEPGVPTIHAFLEEKLQPGMVLGFDGRTISAGEYTTLKSIAEKKGASVSCELDLVGEAWSGRPARSAKPAWLLPVELSGKETGEKIADVRKALAENGADTLILSSLADICWLLNIRGGDVANTPVVLSFAAVTADSLVLFADTDAIAPVRQALALNGVTFDEYNNIYTYVKNLTPGTTVMMDLGVVNSAILAAVPETVTILNHQDPTQLPKAIKNPVEVANMRIAHLKDGVAVTRFMRWLQENAGDPEMTELSASAKLEEFRAQQENFIGPSFSPIVSWGPHGAIVHYSATEETNCRVEPRSFLLVDTGGHYPEGSTDITRTFVMGPLTDEEKEVYTLVLRSHLNLGAARFKYGCTGENLDIFARAPFWEREIDFNHGTGHGVGYLLNIHEGPQGVRWKSKNNKEAAVFVPGMLTSNEPGLYLEGKFGVRHENMVVCVEGTTNSYGHFLRFENLTMVPFDLNAVVPEQMTERERRLLNEYHQQVFEALSPRMLPEEQEWLRNATRAI